MIVSLHTVTDLLILLVASFICGICACVIYFLLLALPRIASSLFFKRFPDFREFQSYFTGIGDNSHYHLVADFWGCVISSFLLLISAFLYNSGILRPSSIIICLVGFYLVKPIFLKIGGCCIMFVTFLFKWMMDVAFSPVIWISGIIFRLIHNTCNCVYRKIKLKVAAKYTDKLFAEIKEVQFHGYINKNRKN